MSWVVPDLGTDFTNDFEDVIIQYIYDKWSITDPAKGTAMIVDPIDEPNTIGFKPGFPDFNKPYEITCIQTKTDPLNKFNEKWMFSTNLEIILRMKRLDRDALNVDPQLENMEQECIRIFKRYMPHEIPGYTDILFDAPTFKRIYNARDSYAKSDWRSVMKIKIVYQKDDLS